MFYRTYRTKRIVLTKVIFLFILVVLFVQDLAWSAISNTNEFKFKEIDFSSGTLSFDDFKSYLLSLQRIADSKNLRLEKFPNLYRMINIEAIESRINFNHVDIECQQVLEELFRFLSKEESNKLAKVIKNFNQKEISESVYYSYINKLSEKTRLNQAEFPNLYDYIRYIKLDEDFDRTKLFKEIDAFNQYVKLVKL